MYSYIEEIELFFVCNILLQRVIFCLLTAQTCLAYLIFVCMHELHIEYVVILKARQNVR